MFKSLVFKNFRAIHDLELESLGRINLIAGKNTVGKTSVLEGIFLHLGPTNLTLAGNLGGFRGLGQIAADPVEVWGWLFPRRKVDELIELTSTSTDGHKRYLRITLAPPDAATDVESRGAGSQQGSLSTGFGQRDLRLEYVIDAASPVVSRATILDEGNLRVKIGRLDHPISPGIFLATHARFPAEQAQRFSVLAQDRRLDAVLSVMRLIVPSLESLSVLVLGGTAVLHADIGMGRLIPIPYLGEGASHLLSFILAIVTAKNGTVLIDEIENGLHYSVLSKLWQAIGQAARDNDVQVFATTHSLECIRAAHTTFRSSGTNDFRLTRLDRVGTEISAVTFDSDSLEDGLKGDLELR